MKKKNKQALRAIKYQKVIHDAVGFAAGSMGPLFGEELEDFYLGWAKVIKSYLKFWGWNSVAIDDFWDFDDDIDGIEEKDEHIPCLDDFLTNLISDADKMTIGKLFRLHWQFRNMELTSIKGKDND